MATIEEKVSRITGKLLASKVVNGVQQRSFSYDRGLEVIFTYRNPGCMRELQQYFTAQVKPRFAGSSLEFANGQGSIRFRCAECKSQEEVDRVYSSFISSVLGGIKRC